MNNSLKLMLLGISLVIITFLLPFFIGLLYSPSVIIDIPNGSVCTDGCGLIPMTDPLIPIILIIFLPLAVIIGIILFVIGSKEVDESKR